MNLCGCIVKEKKIHSVILYQLRHGNIFSGRSRSLLRTGDSRLKDHGTAGMEKGNTGTQKGN